MRIASEGYPFIFGLGMAGIFMFFAHVPALDALAWIAIAGAIFSAFFFRDPDRRPDQDPRFILAPGDGKIMEVVTEEHAFFGGKTRVVRIFLSVFDVHIQHSPIAGRIAKVEYRKGKFLDARDPRAAHENENNSIYIEGPQMKVIVKQIAGLIARRIICKVKIADNVIVGQRLGLIRFGSQVDVYLPMDVEVCVAKGDRVVSGVSVLALNKKIMGTQGMKGKI